MNIGGGEGGRIMYRSIPSKIQTHRHALYETGIISHRLFKFCQTES